MNFFKKVFKRKNVGIVYNRVKCLLKSKWYTYRYVSGSGKIVFRQHFLKLRIVKDPSAKLLLNDDLIIDSHLYLNGCISLILKANSVLKINGTFNIGQNIGIFLNENALLSIGGADKEEVSGITSDTKIMCYKRISIGRDFLCSWNVYISDCDWHAIYKDGEQITSHGAVEIGDHVWIGSNVIINKSTIIGDNVIIGAYTKCSNKKIMEGSIIGGFPPKTISNNMIWRRSL